MSKKRLLFALLFSLWVLRNVALANFNFLFFVR